MGSTGRTEAKLAKVSMWKPDQTLSFKATLNLLR